MRKEILKKIAAILLVVVLLLTGVPMRALAEMNYVGDLETIEENETTQELEFTEHEDEDLSSTAVEEEVRDAQDLQPFAPREMNTIESLFTDPGMQKMVARTLPNQQVSDPVTMEQLKKVKYLYQTPEGGQYIPINDLTGIAHLPNVISIDVRVGHLENLNELQNCLTLEDIEFINMGIKDIGGIKDLPGLKSINLSNNEIEDISAIQNLKNLNELVVDHNKLETLPNNLSSVGSNLSTVRTINISYNPIRQDEIKKLSTINSIVYLEISGLKPSSQNDFAGLTSEITIVSALDNEIMDISIFGNIDNLESLDVSGNKISSVSAAAGALLDGINTLKMDNNGLTDVSGVGACSSLEYLYIKDNKLTDISALSGVNIKNIDASNNQLVDVSSLSAFYDTSDYNITIDLRGQSYKSNVAVTPNHAFPVQVKGFPSAPIEIYNISNEGVYDSETKTISWPNLEASVEYVEYSFQSDIEKIIGWGRAQDIVVPYRFFSGSVQVNVSSNPYSVIYDANGAIGNVPIDTASYALNDTVTVLGNTGGLSKSPYQFDGWNTQANGQGIHVVAGSTFAITANTTLYAQWKSGTTPPTTPPTIPPTTPPTTNRPYTIRYMGNGADAGIAPTDSNTYMISDIVTVLGNTESLPLTKINAEFDGWNTQANGKGIHYGGGDTFNITENTTLYAQWKKMEDSKVTEIDKPKPVTPGTKAPETKASETKAPETKAPVTNPRNNKNSVNPNLPNTGDNSMITTMGRLITISGLGLVILVCGLKKKNNFII